MTVPGATGFMSSKKTISQDVQFNNRRRNAMLLAGIESRRVRYTVNHSYRQIIVDLRRRVCLLFQLVSTGRCSAIPTSAQAHAMRLASSGRHPLSGARHRFVQQTDSQELPYQADRAGNIGDDGR
jgi:hypothetical protein